MSEKFVAYLRKEHRRLEQELETASRQKVLDQFLISRLKKLKLHIRDQIALHESTTNAGIAA